MKKTISCLAQLCLSSVAFGLLPVNHRLPSSRSSCAIRHSVIQSSFSGTELILSVVDMETSSSMGARVDPIATGAFIFVVTIFGLLRLKVSGAVAAKERRLEQELELQRIKISATTGGGGGGLLSAAEEKLATLTLAQEHARSVSMFGGVARIMVPDTNDPRLREVEVWLKRRDQERGAKEDAREEEIGDALKSSPLTLPSKPPDQVTGMGVIQKAALIVIAVSLLGLLVVLSFDPMPPPGDLAPPF
mmetsp:Transcript_14057/g.23832  ORF Transcript_14057/g.23832 Transcript_14057/m.23832 type:complete len:247 (-) Transcript_14057:50-790(-)